jgi:phosphate-selective porin
VRDFTLGLNWYLNPNLRIAWNYLFADPSEGSDVDIFQMRFQLAF